MYESKIIQILPAPPGIQAIFRVARSKNYQLYPAACIALFEEGLTTVMVVDRWGGLIAPTNDETFCGWVFEGETLESMDVKQYLYELEWVESIDPANVGPWRDEQGRFRLPPGKPDAMN